MNISQFPSQLHGSLKANDSACATKDDALMQALRTLCNASEPINAEGDDLPIWT